MRIGSGSLDLVGIDQGYIAGLLDSQEIVKRDLCREFNYKTLRVEYRTKEKEAADIVSKQFSELGLHLPVVLLQDEGLLTFSVTISSIEALCFLYSYIGSISIVRKELIRNIIKAKLDTDALPIETYDITSEGYQYGWLAGMLDSCSGIGVTKGKTGYQLYWSSSNIELYNYFVNALTDLGVEYKRYIFPEKRGRDRYHIRITKGKEICKLVEKVPLRLSSKINQIQELVNWITRQKTKYNPHELAKLHLEKGMTISEIGKSLGEKPSRLGRIAAQIRKAGYQIKTKIDGHKPKEAFEFSDKELEKGYLLLQKGKTAKEVLTLLGKNPARSTAFYKKLEKAGYDTTIAGKRRGKNSEKLDHSLIVKMHIEDGIAPGEIAKAFGFPTSRGGWIANIIRKAGYEPVTNKSIYNVLPEEETTTLPLAKDSPATFHKELCCICNKPVKNHRYYLHLWKNNLIIQHDVALSKEDKENDLGLYKVGNDCIKKYNLMPYRVLAKYVDQQTNPIKNA